MVFALMEYIFGIVLHILLHSSVARVVDVYGELLARLFIVSASFLAQRRNSIIKSIPGKQDTRECNHHNNTVARPLLNLTDYTVFPFLAMPYATPRLYQT